jgi:hypothetical protein
MPRYAFATPRAYGDALDRVGLPDPEGSMRRIDEAESIDGDHAAVVELL